jgi:hypothetical protein
MYVSGRGQRVVQILYKLVHRTVLFAGDHAQGAVVMHVRLQSDGMEQDRRGHVVGMGDERHAHPWADGLIFPTQHPRVPPGTYGE